MSRDKAEQYHQRELLFQRCNMTLGEAMEILTPPGLAPCACMGGVYCCWFRAIVADDLQRGAHIVAKLLADASTPTTTRSQHDQQRQQQQRRQ